MMVFLIAVFLIGSMPLIQGFSSVSEIELYTCSETVSSFKVLLTNEQVQLFDDFIAELSTQEDKIIAQDIKERVLTDNNEVDINVLGGILREYGFEMVYCYEETTDIVDDVLNFVLELIIERFGWVKDLFERTSDVIYDAQRLWYDKSLPKEILDEIDRIIDNLKDLQNFTIMLVEGKYIQFIKAWSPGIIIEDITEIIDSVETITTDLGILVNDVSRFIRDSRDLITWLTSKPWEEPIHIYGRVMQGVKACPNVTITCKGEMVTTDNNGNYSFYVNSTPDDHSMPPDVYYGVHQCVVMVENNGNIKEIPSELSYVFSDGGIYWLFALEEDDSYQRTLISRLISFFPGLYNSMNSWLGDILKI